MHKSARFVLCTIIFLSLFFLGAPSLWSFATSANLLYQKNGDSASDNLGYSVAGAGDVNGDGKADFIVGAPYTSLDGVSSAGSAYIYSGATGTVLYHKKGATDDDNLGWSVAGAGDVNGDSKADFIVGAPFADPGGAIGAGSSFVYSGTTGALLYQIDGDTASLSGISVAGAGDVNGDGKDDFIIGAPIDSPGGLANAGSAFVFSGATGDTLYRKDGSAAGDFLGFFVAGAGDVNGDGKADFLIGAPYASPGGRTNAGSAYVYSGAGGALLYQKDGVAAGDLLGLSVAGAQDINGDGTADFVIGAPFASPGVLTNAGSAFVYSGATGALLYQKDGALDLDQLGTSVAGAGDVNGDGKADFFIGAPYADSGSLVDAGAAYLYSGADGFLLFEKEGLDSDLLGSSVAGVGDATGDGKAEFIIGAPNAQPNGLFGAGSAYVYGLISTDAPKEKPLHPLKFELSQNYPNPFNPTTTIRYSLPKAQKVKLEIFNIIGQRVKVLENGEQTAGEHTLTWNGADEKGEIVPSGVYFYKLTGENLRESKKLIFLK